MSPLESWSLFLCVTFGVGFLLVCISQMGKR